jgi:DNA-binding CsgD family transcriptional regulator
MSKQGIADKRKHVTLMIPQELEIIMMLESGKSQREVMAS